MSSQSKYNMRFNPVYQVDWKNAASGKRVSATKRRIHWRFGFSDAESISRGMTGTSCRGEEHEVSIVWSLTSGKRLVVADGQEVHFSFGKRTDAKFETSWTMSGGHTIKIIAHAAPPLLKTPGFRQFDLQLDGCSFFDMPKIYQLGTNQSTLRALTTVPTSPAAAYNNYSVAPTPMCYDQGSSYGYTEQRQERYEPQTPVRRIAPTRTVQQHQQVSPPQPRQVDMVSDPSPGHHDHFAIPAAAIDQVDEFTPVAPRPPSFRQVSSQILSAYAPTTPNALLALANESQTYMPQQQQSQVGQYQQQTYYQSPVAISPDASMCSVNYDSDSSSRGTPQKAFSPSVVALTMAPMSLEDLEPPMSEMAKALKSLVNLDDITETIVTPESRKAEQKKTAIQQIKSKPLPPTAPVWHLGTKPALSDLKQHATPKAPLAKEIMRTHAFDPAAAQAGMLVVYGASIPQSQGFGAGAQQLQQYYQQQQQYYQQQQQMAYHARAQQQQQPVAYAAY